MIKNLLTLITTIFLGFVYYNIIIYGFYDFYYLDIIIEVLMLVWLILMIKYRKKRWTRLLLVLGIVMGLGLYFPIYESQKIVTDLQPEKTVKNTIYMAVLKSTGIESLKEVSTYAEVQPYPKVKKLLEDKYPLEVDSYATAYDSLTYGGIDGFTIDDTRFSLLEDEMKNQLHLIPMKVMERKVAQPKIIDSDSFNVYISGIDTYGDINSVSRSDVNIIATVNTTTHKVLLTTTPRDSYLPIPGGGNNENDKLTHAGIYGVTTSKQVLSNLYDTNIDYYVRLNFTSFMKLIDVLGGVDVYNDTEFTSEINNKTFPVGNITLDSKDAFAFVRERHALADGDNDRGKNQEKVIAGIINKLASPELLKNYSQVVNQMNDSIQTNINLNQINKLVNAQINSGKSYEVFSQSVEGYGSTGELPSYAMPGYNLYMVQLDDDSVNLASQNIKEILEASE